MKLCKDCKHYDATSASAKTDPHEYAKCTAPAIMKFSPVTGRMSPKFVNYCLTLRMDKQPCGTDAALFEQNPEAQPLAAEAGTEVGQ
ncbi:hypothetical protein UFOVP1095_14 [uncultured Caudovirales phage]|uniref:Uncharacterized protein n=1 Tax=uncultured Caudovirales phage TaxID=2100421 RepID=A0A6J5QN17_9CAUD|nr:hypothetical protein UFOVP918_14 [uncultured Caudovirales phage]CAB4182378.1 hypothetical protein UFOVP1095_14 [uncultured Caudovirales phage]CAB4213926.1 hypothetical protein UFOVP1452_14 [uncultured Caudovirales phage]CAB5228421.1 hypothetical protein UFOVP1540_43 [uncultured Caudovirales phage]